MHNALRRRGVAYDVARAMSFERHEELINLFFNEMQREPLDGFQKVSLEKVAAADREVHVRMAEKQEVVDKRCTRRPSFGWALRDVIASSEVRWLLMPLPKRAPVRNQEPTKKHEGDEEQPKSAAKEDAPEAKQVQTHMPKKILEGSYASCSERRCSFKQ